MHVYICRESRSKLGFYCVGILNRYCEDSVQADKSHYSDICKQFMETVGLHFPSYLYKAKFHTLLHLLDNMVDFGSTNMERYVLILYNNTSCYLPL